MATKIVAGGGVIGRPSRPNESRSKQQPRLMGGVVVSAASWAVRCASLDHIQQQTGVPPIIMQQAQPVFMQPMMQSQHDWIMSQHILSPLVQVMQHPLAVISHLHMPIVMLQQHTIIPFMVQHRLHIPPAIIAHRFCIMVHAAGSSQEQVIFMPPGHFSTFIMHRGTITMFGAIGAVAEPIGMFPIPAIAERSIIIALVMFNSYPGRTRDGNCRSSFPRFPTADFQIFQPMATKNQQKDAGVGCPFTAARVHLLQIRN
jgi:hypothetical protein